MRHALAIRATVSVVRSRRLSASHIEWTTEHRERRSARVPVKRKHLLIERYGLRCWLVYRAGHGIGPAQRELLQNIALKGRGWDGGCRDDGQRYSNPLAIKEEEQLVVDDRSPHASSKMVHGRAWLVTS